MVERKFRAYKKLVGYTSSDAARADLQMEICKKLSCFPAIEIEIKGSQLIQHCEVIQRKPFSSIGPRMNEIWEEFVQDIEQMHAYGYVHGDILLKNILFDGTRLRLVDHELRLTNGNQLRVTYPWVDPEDLASRMVTEKTDRVCLGATYVRLFMPEAYWAYRSAQRNKLTVLLR